MENIIKIAADAIVMRDGKILLGKRKTGYGAGTWGLPGGHVEYGEELSGAAQRELMEETGMRAESFAMRTVLNLKNLNRHYIIFGFEAIHPLGEPQLCEPDKCFEWKWFDLDDLPKELYEPHKGHFELLKNGRTIFED